MPRRRGNGQQRRDKRPESPPPHHTPRHEHISSSSSQGPVYSYVYFGVLIFVVLALAISLFSLWIQHTAQTNALMNTEKNLRDVSMAKNQLEKEALNYKNKFERCTVDSQEQMLMSKLELLSVENDLSSVRMAKNLSDQEVLFCNNNFHRYWNESQEQMLMSKLELLSVENDLSSVRMAKNLSDQEVLFCNNNLHRYWNESQEQISSLQEKLADAKIAATRSGKDADDWNDSSCECERTERYVRSESNSVGRIVRRPTLVGQVANYVSNYLFGVDLF